MNIKYYLTACLCMFTFSCANEVDCGGSFSVDSRFTKRQTATIIQASELVNRFTHKQSIVLEPTGTCSIMPGDTDGHGGEYQPLTGTIKMDVSHIEELNYNSAEINLLFEKLVAHELLHSLGLNHVSSGIMAPVVEPFATFTNEDYQECLRVGACDEKPIGF